MTLFGKILKNFSGLSFFLLGLLLITSACSGGGGNADGTSITDDDIDLGSPDDFSPTGDSNPSESPEEDCDTTQSPSISTSSINFGLNELEGEECQTITINGCYSFSAEFSSSTHATFDLYSSSGSQSDGRLTDQTDSVTVCNNRSEEGTHTGRLTIVVDSGSSAYTFVVNLSSQTVGYMFDITSPTENFAVWEKTATKKTASDGSEYFELNAKGSVNVAELSSIITSSTITITTTAESQSVTYDSSSGSFSTTMKFDSSPAAVSNMDFTIATSKGNITKSIPLIRFTAPSGSVEVRDTTGTIISAADSTPAETDNPQLTSGIYVDNLDVSGPYSSLPVRLSLSVTKEEDGTTTEIFSGKEIYAGIDYGSGEGSCSSYFSNPDSTFCYTLPDISEFGKGTNTLTAILCNDYTDYFGTCTTATTVMIVDNDVPMVNLTQPVDNQLYDVKDTITFSGTLENFLLYETLYELQEQVNEETGETEEVQVEVGQECAVDLWINTDIGVTVGEGDAEDTVEIDLCDSITVTHNEDSNTTNGNSGNTRRAEFTYTLSLSGVNGYHIPTLYTNQALLRIQDANGKIIYKVVSFQRGLKNKATMKYGTSSGSFSSGSKKISTTGELVVGKLGEITNTGSTARAPIMLHVSEATLQEAEIIAVVRKMLNDNLDFTTLAMAFGPNKDEDGNVEPIPVPQSYDEMLEMLHRTSPEQIRALWTYQDGDPSKFFSSEDAQDACGNPITTAVMTPDIYQYLLPSYNPKYLNEWPTALCGENLDCKYVESGLWDIDIDLKDDGFIDVTLTLEPKNQGEPAYFAYFTAYNLIEQGTTGTYPLIDLLGIPVTGTGSSIADPIIPLWMNFSKMTIQLEDMLRIMKAQIDSDGKIKMCTDSSTGSTEPCACEASSNCVNMLYAYFDRMVERINDDNEANNVVIFEPYVDGCRHFREKFPDAELPSGCDSEGVDTSNTFLLDVTSKQGYLLWYNYGDVLVSPSLRLFDQVFEYTLINTLSCLGNQVVNPMIDSSIFPYPEWVNEEDKITELKLALDDAEDGLTLTIAEDAVNPVFTFSPDIVNADINIFDGGLTLKLPLQFSVTDVSTLTMLSMLTSASSVTTRSNGHMYREPSEANFESDHPLMAENNVAYLSASLGAEEFLNSILFAVFKRGPLYYVDLVDEELADDLNITNNYQLGIDNVILGRFGICGSIDILNTDLAPSVLFSNVTNYFTNDSFMHLDIILQKDYSPTLAILPHPEDPTNPDVAVVQIGLPNLQIDVKNHSEVTDENGEVRYEIGDTVFRMRADILLKLVIETVEENGRTKLNIFIPPFNEQVFYFSMVNRGNILNDKEAFYDIRTTVLESNMWPKFASTYDPTSTSNVPSVSITFPQTVSGFGDVENVNLSDLSEEEQEAMSTFEGLLIDNRIAATTIGECEAGEEPLYVGEEYTAEEDDDEESGSSSSSGGMVENLNINIGKLTTTKVGPGIDLPDLTDSCNYDNDIKEALCDMGIDDIAFGSGYPNLYLDYNNGYVHFDISLFVTVLDSLLEEVSTD